jgi:large subunit ribosomal protein L21
MKENTMFAVMKTGGKQYRVKAGDVLKVEKLAADAGETVQFNEILMVGSNVGTPLVEGAGVQAEVVEQTRGKKVIHFVKRRRKHSSQRTKGHRQSLTVLKVTEILEKGAEKSGVKAAIGAGSVAVAVAAVAAKPKAKAAPKPKAEPKAEPKPKVEAKAEAPKSEAPKKAAPKKAAPKKAAAGADDLKELSGVGPVIEKKLHSFGVTTFAQVAAWGPAEIADFDEKLSFKGRIERDDWVAQAKAKAAEKE